MFSCPTCTVAIDSSGVAHHAPDCPVEQLRQHKSVLHKIAHLLKEVGITAIEVPIEVIAKSSNLGGDS